MFIHINKMEKSGFSDWTLDKIDEAFGTKQAFTSLKALFWKRKPKCLNKNNLKIGRFKPNQNGLQHLLNNPDPCPFTYF